MPTLALIRHGPTAWNEAGRLQGRSDIALSPAGRAAVRRWRLPPPVLRFVWITSPLRRCLETTALLRDGHPEAPPARVEPLLIEMGFGAWEGRTLAELRAEHGAAMVEWEARGLDFKAPGGESPREVQTRLRPFLAEIGDGGDNILAVTHRGVIRAVYALASGWNMRDDPPVRLADAAVHLFAVAAGGGPIVERLNLALDAAASEPPAP